MSAPRRLSRRAFTALATLTVLSALPAARSQIDVVVDGQPRAVIMTTPGPKNYVLMAARELQLHWSLISGAQVPIDTVGHESSHPGAAFVYVGVSSATSIAGISTSGLSTEYYIIRTIGQNLYIVGRDGGTDDWTNLSGCQPATMFGVYHLLNEIQGVRWLWPGDDGIVTPKSSTITIPALNLTSGPPMSQRKYRVPRVGLYVNGTATYGLGIPVLPADPARRLELAREDYLWMRRLRLGTRKSPSFGHSETTWWATYGATHPEYFAVLPAGKSQPNPATDRVKLHVSGTATIDARVQAWIDAGKSSSFNVCPNDSRSFCVCPECLAWDRPAQDPSIVYNDSSALLGDRYARWYTEIANRVKAINPNTTVYGYAYDVYKHAPLEATVPANVALAYVPGSPSDTVLSQIAETETDVLGWIAHGCTQMYLRPNWMLSAHAGPFWPTYRMGNHFRHMLAGGYLLGLDSDSSCSSYASFGLYYYMVARLMANPSLTIDQIVDEYCSGFGSAAADARTYFSYWENFIYNQADAGNTTILGWSSGMAAYGTTYTDAVWDGAERILDRAEARLGPDETAARARFEFLRVACIHGRLTAQAIRLVDPAKTLAQNPAAEKAMRSVLAYRDAQADGFALWREWMVDREGYGVPGMDDYWLAIIANPSPGYGSNAGAAIESAGTVTLEAEHADTVAAGTSTAASAAWHEDTTVAGAVGSVMQALPNAGLTLENTTPPRLDFKVDFRTTGTWYVHVRLPALASTDDSVNIGLDGVVTGKNLQNTSGGWAWITKLSTGSTRATINVTTAGTHTFNVWMREDGVSLDRIVLTTSSGLTLAASDTGPAESDHRAAAEALLTVGQGTGDGYYGAGSLVSIAAEAAPADYVFDHWTGDTAALANIYAASTTLTMPAAATRVDAAYKLAAAADSDGDGIADSWEMAAFGNLTTASAAPTSDADHDGMSDLAEYLAGTDPLDSSSRLAIASITPPDADSQVTVTWPSVDGRAYRLLTCTDLAAGDWLPVAVDIAATAPLNTYTIRLDGPRAFVRLELE